MKNKFFCIFFFAVNNLQCVAEGDARITPSEFLDLLDINELKKDLKLLVGKPQRTESQNERITNLKTCIAAYDEKIKDKITELKKDKEKNGHKIKILEGLTSEKVNDELVEEAKKRMSGTNQALYFILYKVPPIVGVLLVAAGPIAGVVLFFKNNKN